MLSCYKWITGVSEILFSLILKGGHAGPGALQGCGLVTSSCEQQHAFTPGSHGKGVVVCVYQEEKKVGGTVLADVDRVRYDIEQLMSCACLTRR